MTRPSLGERWVAWIRRRHAWVLVACGLLGLLGMLGASRLRLRASLRELLPRGDPAAAAADEVQRRLGDLASLVVQVGSKDPAQNRAYAAALASRIEALGPALVERAVCRVPELRDFFDRNRFLYADEKTLEDLLERIQLEKLKRGNPFYVALDEPPTLDEIKARMRGKQPGGGLHLPGGWLQSEDGQLVAIVVLPGEAHEQGGSDARLERAVIGVIAASPPPPGVHVQLAGDVHTNVAEHRAIQQDVAVTSVAVVALVALVVGLFFGRLRAIPLMAVPALLGAVLALGFAGVVFHVLNASTAFLGAIIVGNGINYPIILLARYQEERDRGRETADALTRAVCGTARPTALAAFAAAFAYGSLAITRFRGFSQFGVIGAVGMALCWVASMTLLPALLWQLDRRARARPPVVQVNFGELFARATQRAPMVWLVAGALLTIACGLWLSRWVGDPYEYDFRRLRSVQGEKASPRLDELFGRALSPSVVLTDSREDAPIARDAIMRQARALSPNPVAHAIILDDLIPGTPAEQRRKLALLAALRRQIDDPRTSLLSAATRRDLESYRPPADLRPITLDDVPALAKRPFRERDGTLGRVVLVYPPVEGFSSWNGHDLFRLARAVSVVRLPDGRVLYGAGRAVTFSSMIAAIAHDGAIATLASFAGVTLLTLVLLRGRPTALWVLAALGLGVVWMLGLAAAFGAKLNFLNFVALPITFGLGVDYAANIVIRYQREGRGSATHVLRSTGGAVMLNSLTTIIGYAALLIAHSRALRSFGLLAILGEFACVAAGLLALPALFQLLDSRRGARAAAPIPAG